MGIRNTKQLSPASVMELAGLLILCFVFLVVFLTTTTTAATENGTCNRPILRQHLWSPPRVDPLLCESLRDCKDNNSDVQYVKELCRNPNAKPPNITAPAPGTQRMKRVPVRLPKSKMKPDEQQNVVDMHNYYRRRTKPIAGDMHYMKWDTYLSQVAQKWADNCVFDHGFPEELDIVDQGQNLYIGHDATGHRAALLWWEEFEFYDFETLECEDGEQCGHYTQMAWADSEYVGCGVARCPTLGFYVVCHYRPQGNVPEFKPYTIGAPCSQCWSVKEGAYCSDGLCVSKQDCQDFNLTCACDVKCHNCAVLSPYYCRCICKKGWDSTDCSRPCNNLIDWCGETPGYPDRTYCHEHKYLVRDRFCRQMCLQCKSVESSLSEDDRAKSKDYCCAGQECEEGLVLDNSTCTCYPLCPGPACMSTSSLEAASEENEESHEILNVTVLHPEEREASPEPVQVPKVTSAPAAPVLSSSGHVLMTPRWMELSMIIVYHVSKYIRLPAYDL